MGRLASYRVFGKPFVVSEYASTANDYAAELFPLLTGVAGLQDWDAVFAFAYTDQNRDYQSGRISGQFALAGHPAKLAFLSSSAAAFRRGSVSPGQSRLELGVPAEPSALPYTENALPSLWTQHGVSLAAALIQPLGVALRAGSGEVTASRNAPVSGTLTSETNELLSEPQGQHARFSIDAPSLKAVCGFVSDSVLEFRSVSLQFRSFSPGFACASLLSLDDRPLESAQRILLSVSGLSQNAAQSPSSPTAEVARAQYVPLTVTLPRGAWHANALDAAGAPEQSLPVIDGNRISTDFRSAALAYAFTR